ncbi:MAG: preprotein translocase subunit SecG [Alistipes sp.]|nr:preprotein translocase subunit SecG [Alistipes sp.]
MFNFCIIMIVIASILLILAVLVQSPKSGMAANFGAANQTMGVRQTSDFLEKFTWAMIAAVVFFTLLSVVFSGSNDEKAVEAGVSTDDIENIVGKQAPVEETEEAQVEETSVEETEEAKETEETEEAEGQTK